MAAVLADPVLHFGLPAVLVPFAAPWKPIGVAAGVVGGWLALALAASFRAKKWLGHRAWRSLHYASFAAFALFLGHALMVGTDLKGLGGPILVALSAGPVIWLGLARILLPRRPVRAAAAAA
jgi:predicted ferric reductase